MLDRLHVVFLLLFAAACNGGSAGATNDFAPADSSSIDSSSIDSSSVDLHSIDSYSLDLTPCDDADHCCPRPLPSPCVPNMYEWACATDCPACGYNHHCEPPPAGEGAHCSFPGLECEYFGPTRVQCDCDGIAHFVGWHPG